MPPPPVAKPFLRASHSTLPRLPPHWHGPTLRSYNPKSLELYAQRYYWYVASLPYVVLNRRTAVTRPIARRIMRACQAGSNPTDLAEELLELKSEWFDLLRAQVLGMHRWAHDRSQKGQQLTLEQLFMGKYTDVTPKSVALCAPGEALIRHFFLAPHLHLGLPLPPCPRHGWASVDQGKLHANGCCPARRVYAPTVDEWLVGTHIICDLCCNEKRAAEDTLAELEDEEDAEGEELDAARRAVAQATYSYRCAHAALPTLCPRPPLPSHSYVPLIPPCLASLHTGMAPPSGRTTRSRLSCTHSGTTGMSPRCRTSYSTGAPR
jgi:hypothetical protein